MPFVCIDLPPSATASDALAVSQGVHQALVDTFNVPLDDRFQVVTRHPEGEIVCAPQYLGIAHSAKVVFVQVTCAPGRTVEMKKALYSQVTANIAAGGSFDSADVIINLVESARENWSFGNGIAQYVS